jgi:MFS family permease
MSKDLKFTGLAYNNLVVGTFAGYVAAQLFVGFFVSKISPAIFLSAAVFIWGIVSMCCGFSHSFGTMMVLRVLVGIAEAVSGLVLA